MRPKCRRPCQGFPARSNMVVPSRGHHAGLFCRSDCRGKHPFRPPPRHPYQSFPPPPPLGSRQPKRSVATWLRDSFFGFHVLQFLLFLGRYFLSLNVFATRFAAWLAKNDVVAVDDSHRIFNLDCRVRPVCLAIHSTGNSTHPEVSPTHHGMGGALREHPALSTRPPFMASQGIRGSQRLTTTFSHRDPVFG